LGEKRYGISTYKQYLFITLSGRELYDLSRNKITSIIRKNVPSWVLEKINSGIEVEAFVYVKDSHPTRYFKLSGKKELGKVRYNFVNDDGNPHSVFRVIDGWVIPARFKIKNIISSEVDESGEYCDKIVTMAKTSGKTVEDLENFGKIKPIYSIEVSNLDIFDFVWGDFFKLMSSFTLTKDLTRNVFVLNVLKFATPFINMGSVWL
jgi:hypothetical protein